jgi:uncharacterized sulfatase
VVFAPANPSATATILIRCIAISVVHLCIVAVNSATAGVVGEHVSPQPQPNVVLIISDDHHWADYSFMGHPHVRTPNIDRLATEGLVFTRGYVTSSLCCPSLASIITGLYPHQHRITSNDPPTPAGISPLEFRRSPAFQQGREVMNRHLEAVPTLPRMLADAGCLSLQTGKWWQGSFRRGGFTHGMTRGERHGDEGLGIGRKTMQPICDFVAEARRAKRPFFVWYAPMMPHQPHDPPQRLLEKYVPLAPTPPIARYWAMIEWFDETVGALLRYLDDEGLTQNTVVIYLSDNGWITDPQTGNYASKSKQSPYDGGLRTPIIIRWPGHVKPQHCDRLALSIDLAPTLLAAARLRSTPCMQGINLLDEKALAARTTIFGECFTHESKDLYRPAASLRWRWMIDGDWKLILPELENEPDGSIELFNLADDPHEERNLAQNYPERTDQMRRKIDEWWLSSP